MSQRAPEDERKPSDWRSREILGEDYDPDNPTFGSLRPPPLKPSMLGLLRARTARPSPKARPSSKTTDG